MKVEVGQSQLEDIAIGKSFSSNYSLFRSGLDPKKIFLAAPAKRKNYSQFEARPVKQRTSVLYHNIGLEEVVCLPLKSLASGREAPSYKGILDGDRVLDGTILCQSERVLSFDDSICDLSSMSDFQRKLSGQVGLKRFALNLCLIEIYEHNLGITVPPKSQAIRMVLYEIDKISGYLNRLVDQFNHIKYYPFAIELMKLYEDVESIKKNFFGGWDLCAVLTVGGVTSNFSSSWIQTTNIQLKNLYSNLRKFRKSINENVGPSQLLHFPVENHLLPQDGVWGLTLRSFGLNFDLRKIQKKYFYDEVDFEVPLTAYGSPFDRVQLRVEEIFQSILIVEQVLENIPNTPILSESSPLMQYESTHYTGEFSFQEGVFYNEVEVIDGVYGLLVQFDKSGQRKLNLIHDHFYRLHAFNKMSLNLEVDRLDPLLKSLSIDEYLVGLL